MLPLVVTSSLSTTPRTAAAAAVAAAQLLGKVGADEVAQPPRTEMAGRVGTTAA